MIIHTGQQPFITGDAGIQGIRRVKAKPDLIKLLD